MTEQRTRVLSNSSEQLGTPVRDTASTCPRCGAPTWQLGNEPVCPARDCRHQAAAIAVDRALDQREAPTQEETR